MIVASVAGDIDDFAPAVEAVAFELVDRDQIAEISDLDGVEGVVFRVDGTLSPWRAAREAAAVCRGNGLKSSLHIRMTLGKPGAVQSDDDWVAKRIAESLAAAAAYRDIHVYPDTFADVDRGYFRRHGVVDRFYNPRKAFHVVRSLNGALAGGFGARSDAAYTPMDDGAHVCLTDVEDRRYHLMFPDGLQARDGPSETGLIVDLLSGERSHATRMTDGHFEPPLPSHHCLWMPGS